MRRVVAALLSAGLLAVLPTHAAADGKATARPNPPVLDETTTEFPRSDEVAYRVMTATIAPGTVSPWHTHPAPVAVYVVSGTFTLELDGGESRSLRAGESMLEPIGTRMRAANRGTEPVEVVIFQVSAPDAPFLVPTD